MAKRLIPLLDRILVEKIVPPTKTVSGVLLPESSQASKVECDDFLLLWHFLNYP